MILHSGGQKEEEEEEEDEKSSPSAKEWLHHILKEIKKKEVLPNGGQFPFSPPSLYYYGASCAKSRSISSSSTVELG